jgi:hypothetical protein
MSTPAPLPLHSQLSIVYAALDAAANRLRLPRTSPHRQQAKSIAARYLREGRSRAWAIARGKTALPRVLTAQQAAYFLRHGDLDTTDAAALPDWHPDSPRYAGP